jgi:hypothetical protein
MTTEKAWTTIPSYDIYTGSSYLSCGQSVMLDLKNRMVSTANWTVIGSSDGVSNYEFEGVTGGGSYGGASTSPYDVWANRADVRRAVNGSGPGWCLLKHEFEDTTSYVVLAMEGISDSGGNNGYYAVSEEEFELPADPLLSLPTSSSTVEFHRTSFFVMFSGTYTTRGYFSGSSDGSFFYALNLTIRPAFTGFFMFSRISPESRIPGTPNHVIGLGVDSSGPVSSESESYFRIPFGSYFSPELQKQGTAALVYRGSSTKVMDVDLDPTDCDGEVVLFPMYAVINSESSTLEYKGGLYGRLQDFWIGPFSLNDGDTFPLAGPPEYFKFGLWVVPGDSVPIIGP